jgi:hypothetical protein
VIKDERIYPERLQPNRANKKRVTIQNEKKGKDYMTAKLTRDQIKIDPELRDFLLPLSDEEEKQLRGSLMVEGCLSPLIVDSITGTLLDGHNRYRICTEKNIPFEIKEISMSRKERQKEFILINQLARRNLTPERMKYYRAMLYESVKGEAGFQPGDEWEGNPGGKAVRGQNEPVHDSSQKAAKEVARLTNTSPSTLKRDVKEVKAMKEAGKLDEYTAGKLSKEEKKKILEEAKPVRKARVTVTVTDDPASAAKTLREKFGDAWFKAMVQEAGMELDPVKAKAPKVKPQAKRAKEKPRPQKTKPAKPAEAKPKSGSKSKIIIKPEFKKLPILTYQRWYTEQLEEDLKNNGCKDPLIVQQGSNILVDGYKRHEICERLKIPFHVQYDYYESLEEMATDIVLGDAETFKNYYDPSHENIYKMHLREIVAGTFERMGLSEEVSVNACQGALKILGIIDG